MPTVTISLPEDVKVIAEAEASKAGRTLDQYLADLIIAQADQPVSDDVEAQLSKALNSPGREFSSAEWEAKRRRFDERAGRGA